MLFGSHMKAAAANHLPGAPRAHRCLSAGIASKPQPAERGASPAVHPFSTPLCTAPAFTLSSFPSCPLTADAFSSLVRQAAAHAQKDMVPAPDLDRHVFCRVLEDRGNVTVDEEG